MVSCLKIAIETKSGTIKILKLGLVFSLILNLISAPTVSAQGNRCLIL